MKGNDSSVQDKRKRRPTKT